MKHKYTIAAALYIRGDGLDPDAVTKLLKTEPSHSHRKGDKNIVLSGDEVIGILYEARTGIWCLESGSDSGQIPDHITDLLSKIPFDRSAVGKLSGVEDAYVDLFVSFRTDKDGTGICEFELSEEDVAALGRIGLPVRLKICVGKK
jgi:hypothetical protein